MKITAQEIINIDKTIVMLKEIVKENTFTVKLIHNTYNYANADFTIDDGNPIIKANPYALRYSYQFKTTKNVVDMAYNTIKNELGYTIVGEHTQGTYFAGNTRGYLTTFTFTVTTNK